VEAPTRTAAPAEATPISGIQANLREAAEDGTTGRLVLDIHRGGQLGPIMNEFSGIGLYASPGQLAKAILISVDATQREVLIDTAKPAGMFQSSAERFDMLVPAFGRPTTGDVTVANPAVLKHIEAAIDVAEAYHMPILLLLNPSVASSPRRASA
jgi:hypothetical protein